MKALITGASTGIRREMAIYLSKLGYDLYVVARDKGKLESLKKEVNTKVYVYNYDLSNIDNCYKLYDELKEEKIDIVKWSENPEEYIASALSPATVQSIEINEDEDVFSAKMFSDNNAI